MKFHQLILVLNIAFPTEVVAQAVPEKNDHLTCYRIKDSLKLEDVAVDMIANRVQEEFTVRNCRLKQKKGAFRMCIPSTKNVLTEGVADPTLGGLVKAYDPNRCLQNDFLCYQVSCDTKTLKLPKRKVIDQFNRKGETRTVRFTKQKIEICTPAWKLTNKKKLVVIECPSPTPAPAVSASASPTEPCADDPAYRFYILCQPACPLCCQEYGCADILTFPGLREKACNNKQTALACCISCNVSEAPTASPVKQVDKCQYNKKCLSLLGMSFAPFMPTQGNLLTTVTGPPIDHRLYFGLTSYSLQSWGSNVMNFNAVAMSGYGTEVPGVWMSGNKLIINWSQIFLTLPGGTTSPYLTSPSLNLGQTYCFMVTAQGTHYELHMDGAKVAEGDSTFVRTQISAVRVYASKPISIAADVTISDICYAAM